MRQRIATYFYKVPKIFGLPQQFWSTKLGEDSLENSHCPIPTHYSEREREVGGRREFRGSFMALIVDCIFFVTVVDVTSWGIKLFFLVSSHCMIKLGFCYMLYTFLMQILIMCLFRVYCMDQLDLVVVLLAKALQI